ncbi:heavy-metal-associated domain-containing protein [Robertkochia sediminum]|uniref:heavy-metal-associated domain-containing protein n=1 Tax=Robertkochia sediminum TaxID=2785326 RepID=UPI0019347D48|nr:heavy metal-associated domain-containing protein [Robertkochia sediminum]MBL7473179.1 heavy-metal-associated domain-containing protein [Robertkochia sediminum]
MRTRIIIQNLKCGGCAKTITSRLNQEEDVHGIEVLLDDGAVVVEHENAHTPLEVKQILKQLGYPSVEEENGILTKARSVVSCATGKVRS